MIRRPPRSTRTDTLFPYTTLFRSRELVVPVDRPVRFALRSKDVIHSFWVPSWGLKRAVVPGQVQTLVVTPTRMVETVANSLARVQCSQICGARSEEHTSALQSLMRISYAVFCLKENNCPTTQKPRDVRKQSELLLNDIK